MANFIISPYAISFNSIKNALQQYINNKSTSSVLDTWKDFYTAGAGQTILELDAGVAAFYAFHFILGRREAYLPVAQNYSSILGGAETLGYSASRGHNVHVNIKIRPTVTKSLKKWDVIGSYAEYDVVLLEDITISKDVETVLKCVIGNSAVQGIQITSSEVQQFTFTAEDTTDDCRLVLNDTEVPFTDKLEDAVNDNYIMLSNSYGSVDVFYLNQGGEHISYSVTNGTKKGWTSTSGINGHSVPASAIIHADIIQSRTLNNDGNYTYTGTTYTSNYTYATQDVLYLQYIQRNTLLYSSLDERTLELDYGAVLNLDLDSDYQAVQSADSVRLGASIYHETNNVVRARKDFAKFLQQDNSLGLVDTNDKDINPGLVAVTYLKDTASEDGVRLTKAEKEAYMEKVVKASPDGVAKVFIEDPIPVTRNLEITITAKKDESLPADIEANIDAILAAYQNQLAISVDFNDIEYSLERLQGVKKAEVNFGTKEYSTLTNYKLYDIIKVENIPIGTELQTWNMICTRISPKSGEKEPDWSAANSGTSVVDNNLLWERSNTFVSSVPYRWKERSVFELFSNVAVGYNIYPGCTSYTYPDFEKLTVLDGNVTFNKIKTYDYQLAHWAANTGMVKDEYAIMDRNAERAIYKVAEVLHKTSTTVPDWDTIFDVGDFIQDNAVTWTCQYLGYDSQADYYAGDEIALVIDNKIYVYVATGTITKDTQYSNTKTTGDKKIPFDKSEVINEWVATVTEKEDGKDEEGNPKFITETTYSEGNILWKLENVIENYQPWNASTEVELNTYTQGGDNFYSATDISTTNTGEDWFSSLTDWPSTYTDNNVVWKLDQLTLNGVTRDIVGSSWQALTEYSQDDLIVVDGTYTYVFQVVHVNNNLITENNIIYSVTGYTGLTSSTEPEWTHKTMENGEEVTKAYETVEDNEILWVKMNDVSETAWKANTNFTQGDIITTAGGYYTFASILGTSGYDTPNWAGINNGIVTDNNITWKKLDSTVSMNLAWNEYLKFTYTLNAIK